MTDQRREGHQYRPGFGGIPECSAVITNRLGVGTCMELPDSPIHSQGEAMEGARKLHRGEERCEDCGLPWGNWLDPCVPKVPALSAPPER